MRVKAKTNQELKAEASLQRAEKRQPQSWFVQSCRQFYDARGFLSDKQVATLKALCKYEKGTAPEFRRGRVSLDLGGMFSDPFCPNGLFDPETEAGWDYMMDGFDPTDLYD